MSLPFATADKKQPVQLRLGEGFAGIEPKTIVQAFDEVVDKFGDKPALHQKVLTHVSVSEWLKLFRICKCCNCHIY